MAESAAQVFRREGEYWTLTYEGLTARLHDTRGLQHLSCLLSQPYKEIAALALDSPDRADAVTDLGGNAAERARVNVTRAIRFALGRIAEHHPALAWHLRITVKTGRLSVYRPDPRVPVQWNVQLSPPDPRARENGPGGRT